VSAKLINIVLDLETLSTQEDAAIIQIGARIPGFDMKHILGLCHEFEATIKYEDCIDGTFHVSDSTMSWWEVQHPLTRSIVFSGQDTRIDALTSFKDWIDSIKFGTGGNVAIWGNGSDFDNRLLSYTLDAMGLHRVWDFRNNRDLRTIKALFPIPELAQQSSSSIEMKHTALGDARYEARILNTIWETYPHLQEIL